MPQYQLRAWAEQILFDCRDYVVTADTLEAACLLLREQQAEADDSGSTSHPAIKSAQHCADDVYALDPEEVIDVAAGISLIGEGGVRIRDLIGVPAACEQLGDPLFGPKLADSL